MNAVFSRFARTHRYATVSLASFFLIGLLLACGSSATDNNGSLSNGSTSGSSSKASQHFKVGDKVNVGNTYEVTVNSFQTNPGDDIFKPKDGNQFVVVDVTIKNNSNKEQNLSSILQFTFKDTTGQKYTETILSGINTPDGKLAAGDVVKGQLAYEVPQNQKQFTLAFEADIISSGQTLWDLSL